jgi:hypothetical protein
MMEKTMTAGIIRKAQPTVSQVHTATPLTNIAIAYMQSNDNFIADKVFPIVPVEFMSDLYYKWNKDDFFRDEAQKRADGQESAGSGMNLSTDSYKAAVWGLHKDIGDQTRRNADPAIDIEVSTTRALMGKMLISRDRQFASHYMKTGVWGTDITGVSGGAERWPGLPVVGCDQFGPVQRHRPMVRPRSCRTPA